MSEQTGNGSPSRGRRADTPRPSGEALTRSGRSGRRFARAAILGLIGLAAAGAVVLAIRPPSPGVVSSGEAAIGGPFHLVDENGAPVDQRVLLGKWSAVFFGYTHCPDTCPATLQALNAAGQALGAERARFQVVFISVDPARDTPAEMKLYAGSQGYPSGGLTGLTGTPAQVKVVADAYHAFYAREGSGPDYAVQHSAAIYLMDPQGRFVKPLDETGGPPALARDLRAAMAA